MATASGGVAASTDNNDGDRLAEAGGDERLIVVRPEVVDNVVHVLGNLFQRIYHLIDRTREGSAATGDDLHASVHRLEDFLQLVIDYVSPQSLSLQYVPTTEVVQSLARQLSDRAGCGVRVDAKLAAEGKLLVDAARLSRAFTLLALLLPVRSEPGEVIDVRAVARPAGRSMGLRARVPQRFVAPWSSESEMQWSVAEKLFEMHGGSLQRTAGSAGEVTWEISLPLQS